jgi:membrane protease YdiL (CAAX protease family)
MLENSPKNKRLKKASRKTDVLPWRKKLLVSVIYTLWVLVAFFAGQFLVVGALFVYRQLGLSFEGVNEAVFQTVVTAAVFTCSLIIAIFVPQKILQVTVTKKQLGLTRLPSWFDILAGPLAFIPYLILAAVILAITQALFPSFDVAQHQDVGFRNLYGGWEYSLAFFTLVVIAPVAEETLFRGYLYGALRSRVGIVLAALATSVLFGALHGQWNVGLSVFALSLVMCGLRELTGSIWAGIILHMVKNFIAFYALFIAQSLIQ